MLSPSLLRIKTLAKNDLANKSIFALFASAAEELGELATELQIEENSFGNTYKKIDEGSKAESVDLTICALAIFFARGGTDGELVEIMNRKLDKWQKNQNGSAKSNCATTPMNSMKS